jgi:ligand-binding SRPBCC domain-containing protein
MKLFRLQAELWLPRPREEVFAFFSDAQNLEAITPPWLQFQVLTPAPAAMHPGARIDYRIRVHGLPLRWRTEIREWNPPFGFVDVQLRGPYHHWEHTHTFQERDGGTLCLDQVEYWPKGGALIGWLFVQREVRRIFAYRQERLRAIIAS